MPTTESITPEAKSEAKRRRNRRYLANGGAARIAERAREYRRRLDAIKLERGCADCGYRGHPAALDFDHLPGTEKSFRMSHTRRTWEQMEAEIAKCEVVCANCHRIRTETRRGTSDPC